MTEERVRAVAGLLLVCTALLAGCSLLEPNAEGEVPLMVGAQTVSEKIQKATSPTELLLAVASGVAATMGAAMVGKPKKEE